MSKPNLTQMERMVYKSPIWEFERYLPTAFDDTLSLLEKINKIIYELNKLGVNMNELIDQWNLFVEWVLNEGLEDAVNKKLEQWLKDGTLAELIGNLTKKPEIVLYVSDAYKGKGAKPNFGELVEAFEYLDTVGIEPLKWTIKIVQPYQMMKPLILQDGDYSNVEIVSSTNSTTDYINVQQAQMRTQKRLGTTTEGVITNPAIYGKNVEMPKISINMKAMDKSSTRPADFTQYCCGIVVESSNLVLAEGVKIESFNYSGIIGMGSNVFAVSCSFNSNGNLSQVTADNVKTVAWGSGISIYAGNLIGNLSVANSNAEMGFNISQGSTASINGATARYNGHHGVMATGGSSISIRSGNVSDTIDDNLVAYGGSDIDARYCTCSNSKSNYGVIATRNSTINFDSGTANNNAQSGIMANRGSTIDGTNSKVDGSGVDGCRGANGSTLILTDATITNSGEDGITSEHGSLSILNGATIRGCGKDGLLAYDSEAFGDNVTIANCTNHGAEATRGGKIALNYSNVTGCKYGFQAYGGEINASYSTVSGCVRGLLATQGGLIRAESANVSNCTEFGIMAYASQIFAMSINISGCRVGAQATKGAILNIVDSIFSGNTTGDVQCYNGSQIMAQDTNATVFNPSATFNSFSKQGVIMRVVE